MNFIDITGMGNSGKGAYVDLLREFDNFYVPEWSFEFDLIRIPGGLLDFRHSLVENWSPINSHASYNLFLEVVDKMGRDPKLWNVLGFTKSMPQRYDGKFGGEFRSISTGFANQFKIGSYRAEWPYDGLNESGFKRSIKRLARRFGLREYLLDEVFLVDGADFDARAKNYIEDLYRNFIPDNCKDIILNNAFDPFNPGPGLDMLDARQIFVSRDPRDIYVSGLNTSNLLQQDVKLLGPENDGLSKAFLATDDLELFVKRFKLQMENLYTGSRSDVLHLSFESLILDYEAQVDRVIKFLNLDPARHSRKGHFLNPSNSKKNIGLWKKSSRKDEIQFLTHELREYLVS